VAGGYDGRWRLAKGKCKTSRRKQGWHGGFKSAIQENGDPRDDSEKAEAEAAEVVPGSRSE
jgi:hypothetical protein